MDHKISKIGRVVMKVGYRRESTPIIECDGINNGRIIGMKIEDQTENMTFFCLEETGRIRLLDRERKKRTYSRCGPRGIDYKRLGGLRQTKSSTLLGIGIIEDRRGSKEQESMNGSVRRGYE